MFKIEIDGLIMILGNSITGYNVIRDIKKRYLRNV